MATSVVLLHGQPGSQRDWGRVTAYLDGLRLHIPDRPGYDGTPAGGFFSGARTLLDSLPLEDDYVVVGASWGAGVALATAIADPDRTRGLVLVTPVGSPLAISGFDRWIARPLPGALFAATMRVLAAHSFGLAARAMGSKIDRSTQREIRTEVRRRDMRAAWRAWFVEQRALIDETPLLYERAAEVRRPTIVLAGRHDTAVPPAAARDLADRIPMAVYREVDAGHLLGLEHPEAVAAAIRELVL